MMKFKVITPQDPEYQKELMLRWEVLSKPLGMPPPELKITREEQASLHLIALDKKNVVGCVLFFPEDENSGKVFQMAISEEYRGKGFGRQLLTFLENVLSRRGFKELHLFAKPDSIEFYLQMGYHSEDEFVKQEGCKCQRMKKSLKGEEVENVV
jgi:N-acetylglutamate synthase-like GNAT family acetyltransferase